MRPLFRLVYGVGAYKYGGRCIITGDDSLFMAYATSNKYACWLGEGYTRYLTMLVLVILR